MRDILRYTTPAARFSEALPVGNGSLGAMVYGNFPELKLTLNRDTLWSGRPDYSKILHVKKEIMENVRELIAHKKYYEATERMQTTMLGSWTESYLSAAFLRIRIQKKKEWKDEERYLSMQEASACSKGTWEENQVKTEVIASFADDVAIIRIESEAPVGLVVTLESVLHFVTRMDEGSLLLLGEAPVHVEPNYVECDEPILYGGGMAFGVGVKVTGHDGVLSVTNQKIKIENVSQAVILCTVKTGFCGYDTMPDMDAKKVANDCKEQLESLNMFSFEQLKERHLSVYSPLYQRVFFELKNSKYEKVPVGSCLPQERYWIQNESEMYERLFQYGRYMMLCSSYPQNPYTQPANLQGIWCEDIRPVWSCNWTTNINIQMNYWLTGSCALTECEIPLVQMIKELSEIGRKTARETCGCRGWALFHNTDLWRQTAPSKGEIKYAFWPMAGVWLATHLYQHYLYTQDADFLKEQAYPTLKACAEFCVDWLHEDEKGNLGSSPSTSPENEFLDEKGRICSAGNSATMDIVLMRELLENTKESARGLGVDLEFADRLEKIINQLPDFVIGKYGQLQEWEEDFEEADPGHRHMAHLVGLHPFFQITPWETPELAVAARHSIERRLENSSQYIGWTEAWLVNFYARLGDGEMALKHLKLFLEHCTYQNLMSLHPKLGESFGEREIFQIDGNFGITAGISEMLLQSYGQIVILLPALPDNWKSGKISGLLTRCGCRVEIEWEDGMLEKACLEQVSDGKILVRYQHSFYIELPEGEIVDSCQIGNYFQAEYVGRGGRKVWVKGKDSH